MEFIYRSVSFKAQKPDCDWFGIFSAADTSKLDFQSEMFVLQFEVFKAIFQVSSIWGSQLGYPQNASDCVKETSVR